MSERESERAREGAEMELTNLGDTVPSEHGHRSRCRSGGSLLPNPTRGAVSGLLSGDVPSHVQRSNPLSRSRGVRQGKVNSTRISKEIALMATPECYKFY